MRGGELASGPFFSSDGEWIGFVDPVNLTTLQKVPIFGGPAVTVTDSPNAILGASWGADDPSEGADFRRTGSDGD